MLDKALASVHAQDYTDFDVWVVDDFSDDERVVGVLEKWYHRFEARGITFWPARTEFQSGYQCVPKNLGIFYSRGEFIAYLDDDNTWEPDHLTKMMAAFTPDVDMVYCGINYINETDDDTLTTGKVEAVNWNPELLKEVNYVDTSAMMHSRGSAIVLTARGINVWDEKLRRYADWNLVARFAAAFMVAKPVPDLYINYVWHGNNLQLTRRPAGVYAQNLADMPLENMGE
jgi:glycosyltransferase involved in cell wall biosynthesis